jgi:N-dimethylarginine dimethylaminohydrolase
MKKLVTPRLTMPRPSPPTAGFDVTLLEVDEFAKAEGGLTCMSVVVPPATA